jgi:translation elongation factor EF-4
MRSSSTEFTGDVLEAILDGIPDVKEITKKAIRELIRNAWWDGYKQGEKE